MRVLILGGGGREHALALALARSPSLSSLMCAPGNAGIAQLAACHAIDPADPAAVVALARAQAVDLVVVGPEAPLAAGVADALAAAGVAGWGPSAAAARLEASKGFTKALCASAGIPTAAFARFTDTGAALAHVRAHSLPVVIKADGLMAGKGVVVATTCEEAEEAVCRLGPELVIEEFLDGEEASLFALVDGETVVPFGTARDHKRLEDGDRGPNTGGMGAVSPAPALTPALVEQALERILRPTARALAAAGTPFRGFLYAGLMLTAEGPKLIEYNVRLGDPEAQALLPRLRGDLAALLMAGATGRLAEAPSPDWDPDPAIAVVVAARGYPDAPARGGVVSGLEAAAATGATVVHAGTARDPAGRLIATGGRVLALVGRGPTVAAARAQAYRGVEALDFADGVFRRDIAAPAVLFLCLGNICRSPMAEGLARAEAGRRGMALVLDSAGTGDWHVGHPPDPRAAAEAARHGCDITGQRARKVRATDFHRFPLIVVMDSMNLADVEAWRPAGARARVVRLMDFAPHAGVGDVPDPWHGGPADFERASRLIRAGVAGLLDHLAR
ncbi:MAG: phosphoribosylamine--glycine ligase [Sphingomonadaceae bacterium]